MAKVDINFIGPWRLFLGVRSVTADLSNVDEARNYIETNYGPAYWKKLKSMGIGKKQSIWDNSNVLLNGMNIKQSNTPGLKNGDRLDIVPRVAGG
jgi:molybdopterin converting factor small subunit